MLTSFVLVHKRIDQFLQVIVVRHIRTAGTGAAAAGDVIGDRAAGHTLVLVAERKRFELGRASRLICIRCLRFAASELLLLLSVLLVLLLLIVVMLLLLLVVRCRCQSLAECLAAADRVTVENLSGRQAACLPCLVDGFRVIGDLFRNRLNVFGGGSLAVGRHSDAARGRVMRLRCW